MIFGISVFCLILSVIIHKIKDTKINAYFSVCSSLGIIGSSFYEKMPMLMGYVNFSEVWKVMSPILIFIGIGLWWIVKISFFVLFIFSPVAIDTFCRSDNNID